MWPPNTILKYISYYNALRVFNALSDLISLKYIDIYIISNKF
jgi:hypothetical protein